ncbi:MAG TPA: hypothetical protein VD997_02235 [Phycisphaerales bacterium]|nr:hypothetical protein [Phycisphaerales bacterium]
MLMRTAVLALVLAAGAAHAQMVAPDAAPAPAAQPEQPQTLIRQDPATGMVVRLETTPEEAALELVKLDEKEKAAVDKALAERGAIIDKAVSANIGTLLKSQGFRKDDTNQERMQALVELQKQAGKSLEAYNKEHGSLMQQIEKLIAPEKAATVRRLASDYRTAIQLQNEATFRTSKEKDEQKRMSQIRGMEAMLAFGVEVRRSYDRHIAAKEGQLSAMLTKAGVTPEQEATVQGLTAEYQMTTEGRPTVTQRREFFQKVFGALDDRQKLLLLSEIYGVKPPEAAPQPVPAPVAEPKKSSAIPSPITDEAIAVLDRNKAMKEWSSRKAFLQKNPDLPESTRVRLEVEVEKCKAQMFKEHEKSRRK